MRIYAITYRGRWPDDECSVVVAESPKRALEQLTQKLRASGLLDEGEVVDGTVTEIDPTKPGVFVPVGGE